MMRWRVATACTAVIAALVLGAAAAAFPRGRLGAWSGIGPPAAGAVPVVATAAPPTVPPTPPSPSAPAPGTTSPIPRATATSPTRPTANLASRLTTVPASTSQLVIVHAASSIATTATLETFTRTSAGWSPQWSAMLARVGSAGITTHPSESLSATPSGMFRFGSTMYGIAASPGVHYSWHHLVEDDYWDENPDSPSYNTFVHGTDPGGGSEALWTATPAYDYFAVIGYNTPPAVPGAGSGFFLHVGTGTATAGCVSLPRDDLVSVLRWLDPARNPRILIATDAQLSGY